MMLRRVLLVILTISILFSISLLTFSLRVRVSAIALINSAGGIRSTSDAKREIAFWRGRPGRVFMETTDQSGDQTYDVRVENGVLHVLGVVPPTFLGMTISLHSGELRYITVVMFTGRHPSSTTGVWIQAWFDLDNVSRFRVDSKERPLKAMLEFSSAVPELDRRRAFALNAICFVRPGGCKTADDILPHVFEWPERKPGTVH